MEDIATPAAALITADEFAPAARSVGAERASRSAFLIIAPAITAGLWFFLVSFTAPGPGRPGIDENAYLVAGRMIAEHGSTRFVPGDPYQFVGAMWIRTDSGAYYPKYPFGLPLLNAVTVLLGHREWAFLIGPLCVSLATLGVFFLARSIVGSFHALLAIVVLAMGPTTLQLGILPSSHAPALCFVVWGMFFLLKWAEDGRRWSGVLAGLLLGYAVTIRYSEALLLLPLGVAVISRVKWKSARSYASAALPVAAWCVPVGALALFNWMTIGRLTGYDDTGESSGFTLDYLNSKWSFTAYQVYLFGLFFIAPFGVAGLIHMFGRAWRKALVLTLWFLPGTLLYTAYYWGAGMPGVAYLRFFLTLFPPLIIAAMWLLRSTGETRDGARSIVAPLAACVVTAIAASTGLCTSLGELERQHRGTLNLHYSAVQIMRHAKSVHSKSAKPMVIADTGLFPQLLQYMQFMLDADWYAAGVFGQRAGGGFGVAGMFQQMRDKSKTTPVALQRNRLDYIDSVRKGKKDADFIREEQRLIDSALSDGRKVYVVLSPALAEAYRRRDLAGGGFEWVELERWTEPCAVPYPPPGEHNWLELPAWGDDALIPWHAQSRAIFEVRPAPSRHRSQNLPSATTAPFAT